jgi:hypothetical protein
MDANMDSAKEQANGVWQGTQEQTERKKNQSHLRTINYP